MMNRRDLLNLAATSTAVSMLPDSSSAAAETSPTTHIVDTNASLFHWPFRRLPLDETSKLIAKYRDLGIAKAWVGSFDALLRRDMTAVNRRLVNACQSHPELIPVGSVNPRIDGWEEDLRRCLQDFKMRVIRLFPNYHGYGGSLDAPSVAKLLDITGKVGTLVQLAVTMEDTRTQNTMVQIEDVDTTPLPGLLRRIPKARVQILNLRGSNFANLAATKNLYFDTSRADSTDGVPKLVKTVGVERVMFGTHAPFLIPEASLIRIHETSQLGDGQMRQVLSANAAQFLS